MDFPIALALFAQSSRMTVPPRKAADELYFC
jgi:hypothetical protein